MGKIPNKGEGEGAVKSKICKFENRFKISSSVHQIIKKLINQCGI